MLMASLDTGPLMNRTATMAAVGVAAWLAVGVAQQPPPASSAPSQTTFRAGVDVVTLDVSVFDSRRRPVKGLTAEDFTVIEDGRALPVVAFKAVDLPDRHAYAAPWMRDVPSDVVTNRQDADRVVVLLLDDFNVDYAPADVASTKSIAHAVINELGPADMAAVVYTFRMEKTQEFTGDRTLLRAAVDRFTSSKFPPMPGPAVPSMACPHNECVTAALRAISQALRDGWPGRRKTIAFVSPEGTFRIGPQGIGGAADGLTMAGDSAGIWDSGPDLERTFRALQEANANVYQYDPRGLMGSLGIDIAANTSSVMGMFADNSGGRIVTRTNAPDERVNEMFVENDSYYLLGVQPVNTKADGKFRSVKVQVARDGVDVRTRSGYYAPTAEKPPKRPKDAAATALDKAMAGTRPTGDLPMHLTVVPFAVAGPVGSAVAVVAGLDRSEDWPAKDVVDIAARAFSQATADRKSKGTATAKLELTRRSAATGVVHYDVATRLDLAPGRYEVRLAMDSAATHLSGSAFQVITVPDFAKDPLTLSGVVFTRVPTSAPGGKDPLAGVLSFTPTTTREFEQSQRIRALLRVYQGMKEQVGPVAMSASVMDATDRKVFEHTATVQPNVFLPTPRTAEYQLELPLARLAEGEYLLSIEARRGQASQTRQIRFKVSE